MLSNVAEAEKKQTNRDYRENDFSTENVGNQVSISSATKFGEYASKVGKIGSRNEKVRGFVAKLKGGSLLNLAKNLQAE